MKKDQVENLNTCPLCGSLMKPYIKDLNFTILKCKKCGFGMTENLKAYKGEYHRDDTYISEDKLFKNIFSKRVRLVNIFIKRGKVLEIGCSTGTMLTLFKEKGFSVLGVEISIPAAKIAESRGIKVLTTPFEKLALKEKFDVIIFNHTLEHLEDPVGVIKKCYLMLNKKGLLFIDLPNFGSLSLKLHRKNWPMLLPGEHLWHFTRKSMNLLLEKHGFKVKYFEQVSGIWDYGSPFDELIDSLKSLKKRFIFNFLTAIPSFVVSKLNIGTGLTTIAQKK